MDENMDPEVGCSSEFNIASLGDFQGWESSAAFASDSTPGDVSVKGNEKRPYENDTEARTEERPFKRRERPAPATAASATSSAPGRRDKLGFTRLNYNGAFRTPRWQACVSDNGKNRYGRTLPSICHAALESDLLSLKYNKSPVNFPTWTRGQLSAMLKDYDDRADEELSKEKSRFQNVVMEQNAEAARRYREVCGRIQAFEAAVLSQRAAKERREAENAAKERREAERAAAQEAKRLSALLSLSAEERAEKAAAHKAESEKWAEIRRAARERREAEAARRRAEREEQRAAKKRRDEAEAARRRAEREEQRAAKKRRDEAEAARRRAEREEKLAAKKRRDEAEAARRRAEREEKLAAKERREAEAAARRRTAFTEREEKRAAKERREAEAARRKADKEAAREERTAHAFSRDAISEYIMEEMEKGSFGEQLQTLAKESKKNNDSTKARNKRLRALVDAKNKSRAGGPAATNPQSLVLSDTFREIQIMVSPSVTRLAMDWNKKKGRYITSKGAAFALRASFCLDRFAVRVRVVYVDQGGPSAGVGVSGYGMTGKGSGTESQDLPEPTKLLLHDVHAVQGQVYKTHGVTHIQCFEKGKPADADTHDKHCSVICVMDTKHALTDQRPLLTSHGFEVSSEYLFEVVPFDLAGGMRSPELDARRDQWRKDNPTKEPGEEVPDDGSFPPVTRERSLQFIQHGLARSRQTMGKGKKQDTELWLMRGNWDNKPIHDGKFNEMFFSFPIALQEHFWQLCQSPVTVVSLRIQIIFPLKNAKFNSARGSLGDHPDTPHPSCPYRTNYGLHVLLTEEEHAVLTSVALGPKVGPSSGLATVNPAGTGIASDEDARKWKVVLEEVRQRFRATGDVSF